eukprot:SM000028S10054  [mRNA]  locus=s28:167059:175569:+ [translate_table: standard]
MTGLGRWLARLMAKPHPADGYDPVKLGKLYEQDTDCRFDHRWLGFQKPQEVFAQFPRVLTFWKFPGDKPFRFCFRILPAAIEPPPPAMAAWPFSPVSAVTYPPHTWPSKDYLRHCKRLRSVSQAEALCADVCWFLGTSVFRPGAPRQEVDVGPLLVRFEEEYCWKTDIATFTAELSCCLKDFARSPDNSILSPSAVAISMTSPGGQLPSPEYNGDFDEPRARRDENERMSAVDEYRAEQLSPLCGHAPELGSPSASSPSVPPMVQQPRDVDHGRLHQPAASDQSVRRTWPLPLKLQEGLAKADVHRDNLMTTSVDVGARKRSSQEALEGNEKLAGASKRPKTLEVSRDVPDSSAAQFQQSLLEQPASPLVEQKPSGGVETRKDYKIPQSIRLHQEDVLAIKGVQSSKVGSHGGQLQGMKAVDAQLTQQRVLLQASEDHVDGQMIEAMVAEQDPADGGVADDEPALDALDQEVRRAELQALEGRARLAMLKLKQHPARAEAGRAAAKYAPAERPKPRRSLSPRLPPASSEQVKVMAGIGRWLARLMAARAAAAGYENSGVRHLFERETGRAIDLKMLGFAQLTALFAKFDCVLTIWHFPKGSPCRLFPPNVKPPPEARRHAPFEGGCFVDYPPAVFPSEEYLQHCRRYRDASKMVALLADFHYFLDKVLEGPEARDGLFVESLLERFGANYCWRVDDRQGPAHRAHLYDCVRARACLTDSGYVYQRPSAAAGEVCTSMQTTATPSDNHPDTDDACAKRHPHPRAEVAGDCPQGVAPGWTLDVPPRHDDAGSHQYEAQSSGAGTLASQVASPSASSQSLSLAAWQPQQAAESRPLPATLGAAHSMLDAKRTEVLLPVKQENDAPSRAQPRPASQQASREKLDVVVSRDAAQSADMGTGQPVPINTSQVAVAVAGTAVEAQIKTGGDSVQPGETFSSVLGARRVLPKSEIPEEQLEGHGVFLAGTGTPVARAENKRSLALVSEEDMELEDPVKKPKISDAGVPDSIPLLDNVPAEDATLAQSSDKLHAQEDSHQVTIAEEDKGTAKAQVTPASQAAVQVERSTIADLPQTGSQQVEEMVLHGSRAALPAKVSDVAELHTRASARADAEQEADDLCQEVAKAELQALLQLGKVALLKLRVHERQGQKLYAELEQIMADIKVHGHKWCSAVTFREVKMQGLEGDTENPHHVVMVHSSLCFCPGLSAPRTKFGKRCRSHAQHLETSPVQLFQGATKAACLIYT